MKNPRYIFPLIFSAGTLLPLNANAQLPWTVVSPAPVPYNLNSVTYGNGQYVAVGNSGTILTSSDGTAWTLQTWSCDTGTLIIHGLSSVTYGNGRYAAVGAITQFILPPGLPWGNNYPISSSDGITWVGQAILAMATLGFVTYTNGIFTSFADQPVHIRSADGLSWMYYYSGTCNWFTYQNGHYVFVSGSGSINVNRILDNLNGIAVRFSGTTRKLTYIIYSTGQFVVVGDSGTILTSPDDSIWTIRPTGINANLKSVTNGNGQYVTVGASGTILNSPDGISWALNSSGTTDSLNSVATDGAGQYVAVGNNGTIVISGTAASPSVPALVSPADGSSDIPVTPTMRWGSAARASSYHLQIATDSAFTTIAIEDSTLTGGMTVVSVLSVNTTYYWRMHAKNAGGVSAWSEVWGFETGTSAVLPDDPYRPSTFSVSGSYGVVHYSLASACHVSLKFYDLRGRLVATLVNAVQGAGYYVLSVKNVLPSRGTYIRVFEAGSFIKRDLTAIVGK